jgi:uracil-DNA glycosylase
MSKRQPDTLAKEVLDGLSQDWLNLIIKRNKDLIELTQIYNQIESAAATCTPPPTMWFEWARLTELSEIKVMILGQDPYPTPGMAQGLAFSTQTNTCPDSLRNITKCLQHHKLIADYKSVSYNLVSWANQGVLLLNTALSTIPNQRKSHSTVWVGFMRRIIVRIMQYHIANDFIIFCWGRDAEMLIDAITVNTAHRFHILKWCHPSPLNGNKFLECDHFNRANDILAASGKSPINWASIETKNHSHVVNDHNIADNRQVIFTDGSAVSPTNRGGGGNKKDKNCRGGYAVVFVSGPITGSLLGNLDVSKIYASNIRAEGQAIISALAKCAELTRPVIVDIYTDSEFWINMLTKYMPKWSAAKFAEKENSDMTIYMWGLWKKVVALHRVGIHHVYSHNKSGLRDSADSSKQFLYKWNAMADKLADEARTSLVPGATLWKEF